MAEFLAEYWWAFILGVVFLAGASYAAPKRRRQAAGKGDGAVASTAALSTDGDCGPGGDGGCDGGGGD